MKPKTLIILIIVLVVLGGLVILKNAAKEEPKMTEQVGLVSLVSDGLSKSDIKKLKLFSGSKPDEAVVLEYDDEADKWRVATHFNAPAVETKVEEYIEKAVGLQGEFRVTASSDEDKDEYNLSDKTAFHMTGFEKGSDVESFHILVGKSPEGDYQNVFARKLGSDDVMVIDSNPRSDAGLYGDDTERVPEADRWLEKTILELDNENIDKLELATPDIQLVFEKRQKEVENPEDTEEASVPLPEPPIEYEWVLASGGPEGIDHKQSELENILRKFNRLSASDIVDPAKKDEWGLDTPSFTAKISLSTQEEDIVLEAGRPDLDEDGYVRIAGAKDDVVYKLSGYSFEGIFEKSGSLFELPKLDADEDKIKRVELTVDSEKVILKKDENLWTVASPLADLSVDEAKIETLVSTLSSWKPEGYADSDKVGALGKAVNVATIIPEDGEKTTIKLGAKSKAVQGSHALLNDSQQLLVMSSQDIEKIFVAPKDLYERTLLDIDEDDISEVKVERKDDPFTLTRKDDVWTLSSNDGDSQADQDAVNDLTYELAGLQASDIIFDKSQLDGKAAATITIKVNDEEYVFAFSKESKGQRSLTLSGKNQIFKIKSDDAQEILVDSKDLKKSEPEPEEKSASES